MTPPYEAYHYNGYLVEFKWLAPVSTSGLLTKFVLQAYNLDNTTIDPVEATFTNTSKREGNSSPYCKQLYHVIDAEKNNDVFYINECFVCKSKGTGIDHPKALPPGHSQTSLHD